VPQPQRTPRGDEGSYQAVDKHCKNAFWGGERRPYIAGKGRPSDKNNCVLTKNFVMQSHAHAGLMDREC
jgi:hypothetical protein